MDTRRLMVIIFCVVFVAVICVGFYLVGSPQHNRKLNEDRFKTNDINNIYYLINDYYRQECKLPKDLSELDKNNYNYENLKFDIKTYGYKSVGKKSYELCADFYAESKESSRYHYYKKHEAGFSCIPYEVDSYIKCKNEK